MNRIRTSVIDQAISLCEKSEELNIFKTITNIVADPSKFEKSNELTEFYKSHLRKSISNNLADIFFLSHSEMDKDVVEKLAEFFIYKTQY